MTGAFAFFILFFSIWASSGNSETIEALDQWLIQEPGILQDPEKRGAFAEALARYFSFNASGVNEYYFREFEALSKASPLIRERLFKTQEPGRFSITVKKKPTDGTKMIANL